MKTLRLALIVGLAIEITLCVLFRLFGKVSFVRSEDENLIGGVIFFLHLPGMILSKHLFTQSPNHSGVYWPALLFIMATGAVQFFLLTGIGILVYRRLRRANAA